MRSSDLTGENKSINYSLLEVLGVLYLFLMQNTTFFILDWVKVNRTQEALSACWITIAETANTEDKDSISAT